MAKYHADRLRLEHERQRHALTIVRRFFDVLLADRAYARDNEDMAIAFVSLKNVRERNQLGQLSDLVVMQAENRYAESLSLRNASALAQRASRARLAEAVGRPGDLSSELVDPHLDYLDREPPRVELLVDAAMARNPRLRWLRAEQEVARASIEAANAARDQLNVEHGDHSETGRTSPSFGVGALCDPVDPAVRRSQFLWKQKSVADAEAEVRQAVLETWQRVSEKRFEIRARQTRLDYRELYLDRSRAMYDLEIRADLGDAMVQLTAAEADFSAARYDLAMAMQRLSVLSGMKFLSGDRNTGG